MPVEPVEAIPAPVAPANGHPKTKVQGFLSIYPGDTVPLDDDVTNALTTVQEKYFKGIPMWLIIQTVEGRFGDIGPLLYNSFYNQRKDFVGHKEIALIIESGGGQAEDAYNIAKLINNRSSFKAYVPLYAKSAATLLAFGAKEIHIAIDGQLGPLDVQILDEEKEERNSALDELQSMDSLFEFANRSTIQLTHFWAQMLSKKKITVFPRAIDFVTDMMRPLLGKIDTVHYTVLSRYLRIAEEYAVRLLAKHYSQSSAKLIAQRFVRNYPYHGFNIDFEESKSIGLTNISLLDEGFCETMQPILESGRNLAGKFYTKQTNE
jgi:hypothetical protein